MISAFAPFLAGLGLFFSGVHFISVNLTPLAGRRFRAMLSRVSSHPLAAAISGIVAGLITQSSNAVTYVAIGLVNANAIDLRRAILIPTWSHVGTSALVMLVAIDFRIAASYLVAIAGIGIYYGLSRNDQSRSVINILLGIGLLFLGIEMLNSGAVPLRDILIQDGSVAAVSGAAGFAMLFGAILTVICQSSSIAGAITVAATNIGPIDFKIACWIIYGANLGSAFNHYLLATSYHGEARQIALMQTIQKLAGFLGMLVLLAVSAVVQQPLVERAATMMASDPGGQIAWVFLVYQIIGSLACTLGFAPLLRLLWRLAPQSPFQEMSKAAFLVDEALVDPSLALELATREEDRLVQRLPMLLDDVRSDETETVGSAELLRSTSHSIMAAMERYLEAILEVDLDRRDRERVIRLQHRTANLGALFDAVCEFRSAVIVAGQWPISARVTGNMVEALHALLAALADASASNDADERDLVLSLLGHRDELMEHMRQRVLRENPDLPPKAQEALFSATMLFERIVWLARRGTLLLAPARVGEAAAKSR